MNSLNVWSAIILLSAMALGMLVISTGKAVVEAFVQLEDE